MRIPFVIIICLLLFCCSASQKDPGEVLNNARSHVKRKEYSEALNAYKWFFENSTKIQESWFGVKHSYCVNEWRNLGDLYESALKSYRDELKNRKDRLMGGESDWDLFMEFLALCQYDDKMKEVVKIFIFYHNMDKKRDFAGRIFRPIKEELLALGHIDICSNYLENPIREASRITEMHQMNVEIEKRRNNECGDESFADSMYYDEVNYLITVLRKSSRKNELEDVLNIFQNYHFPETLNKLIVQ